MPEGPEVRRAADRLHEALAGQTIRLFGARTKKARAWLEEHPDAFVGKRVERVWAHGKHLVGDVDGGGSFDGLFFHSHFLMWGRWLVVAPDAPEVETRDRRERARIVTDEAAALLYSAPKFTVGAGDPYAGIPALPRLGPDVLPYEGRFDADAFLGRLDQEPGRAIGAALLDQTVAAGIGNYLRAEILYRCRIDPFRPVGDLEQEARACLVAEIPALSRRAYEDGGRTVPDETQALMVAERDLRYSPFAKPWNTQHWVFRRTNLPCLRCDDYVRQKHQVTREWKGDDGETVEKKRIIYFCPTCQGVSGPVPPARPHKDRRPDDSTWAEEPAPEEADA
ncbi:MAG: DNA-formamidopyrimidine glycosylase family protein [Rubricoccaceae bacterium]|nr:DNA-formamidopyrimidine glycosylase family protein [Rubricoccaceae bacterium]